MWLNGNVCPQHVSGINTVQEETDTTTSEAQHNSLWSLELIPPSSKSFFFSPFPIARLSSSRLHWKWEGQLESWKLERKRERKWKWNPIRPQSVAVCQQQPLMQAVMGNVPGAMEWGIERGVRWPAHWAEVESAFTASITERHWPPPSSSCTILHHVPQHLHPSLSLSLLSLFSSSPSSFCWNDLTRWIKSLFKC